MLDGGVASTLRPVPPPINPATAAVENWESYFAKNRLAAERALALGGELDVQTINPSGWHRLKQGQPLPPGPFVVCMWSIKNSTTVSSEDLDVLAGLRHVQTINLMVSGRRLDAAVIPKVAALQSPLKELGLGNLALKTSQLNQLPVMRNLHLLWLTGDQVDDNWRFLRHFPALRSIELFGTPLPDLSPLADLPQLRLIRLTNCGDLPDPAKIREIQSRHPQLRILYQTGDTLEVLGNDPARIAARRYLEAGIPLLALNARGARQPVTLAEFEQTVAARYVVGFIPRNVALTDELRDLLTHLEIEHFQGEGQRDADSIARVLHDRQDMPTLKLTDADFTDEGLRLLHSLTGLSALNVCGTQVTATGLTSFRQAVPDCFIEATTGNMLPAYRSASVAELPSVALPQPQRAEMPSKTSESLETYFAHNRQAAERALALGGDVTVEITKPVEWRTLKAGESLPTQDFVVRMWSIKNSPTATNADLDVLAGLRHVLQLNVMTKSKLDAEIIPKIALLQSPVKELGIGHLQLKTSKLEQLPVMPNVHVLWLSSEQVDDGWKFLRRFPGLRSLMLYGAPLPDLGPLGDVPQLRTLQLTAWGELPAADKIRDVQTRNPQLRILYQESGESKVLGTDPAQSAARRLVEAGIPVEFFAADGARRELTRAEVDKTVASNYVVLSIPRGVELTEDLRNLLTHVSLQSFQAEGLRKADSLAQLLNDRQDIDHLNLTESDLTDEGLLLLSRIIGLRGLNVSGTQVTAAGVAAFHRAVPGCFISAATGNIDADYAVRSGQ
jgi:hypothetical protein